MELILVTKINRPTHELLQAQNDDTNGNIEFLKLFPVVAADELLETGTAIFYFCP